MKTLDKIFTALVFSTFIICFLIGLTSATPPQQQTQCCCIPKQTIVKSFRAMFFLEDEIKNYIELMSKQGYVVKSVSMMDDETWSKGVVVMEKY